MDDLTRRLRLRLLCGEIARAEAVREARLAVPKVFAAYDVGKALGAAEEREECARLVDAEAACREHGGWLSRATEAEEIAAAIRRRG